MMFIVGVLSAGGMTTAGGLNGGVVGCTRDMQPTRDTINRTKITILISGLPNFRQPEIYALLRLLVHRVLRRVPSRILRQPQIPMQ